MFIITNINDTLGNISRKFGNLKSLSFVSDPYSIRPIPLNLLQDFLSSNLSLKTLKLDNHNIEYEQLLPVLTSFEGARNLRHMKLGCISRNQDFEDIRNHFVNLEVLELTHILDNIGPESFRKVFQLPNLKKISILSGFRGSSFWLELFSITPINYKITELVLNENLIADNALIACMKCLPNISSFECESVSFNRFRLFQAMSMKWRSLESLILKFTFDSKRFDDILFDDRPINFEKLTRAELYGSNLYRVKFVNCLKATNLKHLILYEANILELRTFQKVLCTLSENCPNIERLDLSGDETDLKLIRFIPSCFKTVRTLHVFGDLTKEWMSEKDMTKLLKCMKSAFLRKIVFSANNIKPSEKLKAIAKKNCVEFKNGSVKRILKKDKEIFYCN